MSNHFSRNRKKSSACLFQWQLGGKDCWMGHDFSRPSREWDQSLSSQHQKLAIFQRDSNQDDSIYRLLDSAQRLWESTWTEWKPRRYTRISSKSGDMIITRPDIGLTHRWCLHPEVSPSQGSFIKQMPLTPLAQYFQYRQLNLDMFKNFKAAWSWTQRALIDSSLSWKPADHYGRKILLLFAANSDQSR